MYMGETYTLPKKHQQQQQQKKTKQAKHNNQKNNESAMIIPNVKPPALARAVIYCLVDAESFEEF